MTKPKLISTQTLGQVTSTAAPLPEKLVIEVITFPNAVPHNPIKNRNFAVRAKAHHICSGIVLSDFARPVVRKAMMRGTQRALITNDYMVQSRTILFLFTNNWLLIAVRRFLLLLKAKLMT